MGRALPGIALALGLLAVTKALDNALAELKLNLDASALLGGGFWLLLLAYLIRCLASGSGPVGAAMRGITSHLVDSARSLGVHGFALSRRVHWPLLRSGLLAALLLAFADIARDLPIILLLRPAGWDTLAVRVFELAQTGQWQEAALPGLALMLVGMPQILVLALGMRGRRHGR